MMYNVGKLHRLCHTEPSAEWQLCGSLSNAIHNAPGTARCKLWLCGIVSLGGTLYLGIARTPLESKPKAQE